MGQMNSCARCGGSVNLCLGPNRDVSVETMGGPFYHCDPLAGYYGEGNKRRACWEEVVAIFEMANLDPLPVRKFWT